MLARLFLFALGFAAGLVVGAAGMLVAFPYLFPPPELNETLAAAERPREIRRGRIDEAAPGRDPVHWGKGDLAVYETVAGEALQLGEGFEVGPGPNYWVYLNTRAGIGEEKDFAADQGRRRIAKLKSFKGAQVYRLPADAPIDRFKAVTIWCESFDAYIASADLTPAE